MGAATPLIVSYSQGSGFGTPRLGERISISADGQFVMWRSVAWATEPPTAVGRFAGTLPASERNVIQAEVSAANAFGRFIRRISPDGAVESIFTDQTSADVSVPVVPDNVWGALIIRLRRYLHYLTHFPQAALTLRLSEDWRRAQLIYIGDQPLKLDLSEVTLHAALWKPSESITIAEWTSNPISLTGTVEASASWTFEVPFSPDFETVSGSAIQLTATLTAFDADRPVSVAVSSDAK